MNYEVVVTCAVTGAGDTTGRHPGVPVTPEQIADAAIEAAIDTVARLAAMGAGGAVCHTAGFAETGGEGARLEAALVEAAGDLALIGPNCRGHQLPRSGRPVAICARGLVPGLWGRHRHPERHALVAAYLCREGNDVVEVNPLFVLRDRVCAVDALMRVAGCGDGVGQSTSIVREVSETRP